MDCLAEGRAISLPARGVATVSARKVEGVQGYGVSLNIKNMEYKTIDDSKETKAHSSSHDDEEGRYCVLARLFMCL